MLTQRAMTITTPRQPWSDHDAWKKYRLSLARTAEFESQRSTAIATAVTDGITWAEIGRALGVTAQAAHQHCRWNRHNPIIGETWHEPPLPRS